jgi:SAM-dependent methyltransferase
VIAAETPLRRGPELSRRYTTADLGVLTQAEARRFLPDGADSRGDATLDWELLYRLEPELYDRLVTAERLHPGVLEWLPHDIARVVEVGAGTGRLTLELIDRAKEVIAVEPAQPLREVLSRKLSREDSGDRVRVVHGFFDDLPVEDDSADLVISCSALTPTTSHGGDVGLAEMERICAPGGTIVIVWPNNLDWLASRGYRHESFAGEMFLEFASPEEAAELTAVFYPSSLEEVRRLGGARVPYELFGVNPPRDLAHKTMPR